MRPSYQSAGCVESWKLSSGSTNGAIASTGSTPRSRRCVLSFWKCANSALAIVPSATLSGTVGASWASVASRSKAVSSPYASTPSRSMTAGSMAQTVGCCAKTQSVDPHPRCAPMLVQRLPTGGRHANMVRGTTITDENGFAALGARPETVAALEAVGITQPFPIQRMTLQIAMGRHDLIGQARTGTGKTLGFGVPMLQNVKSKEEGSNGVPQGLVVVPTRELCVQVASDLEIAGKTRGIRVQSIYGGRAFEPQVESLKKGVE